MASKKWKTSSLPFFKTRVKDMPDPLNSQSSGRSVGTDYKMRLMHRKQAGFSGEVPKHRYGDELAPQEASQPSDKKGYSHTRSDSAGSLPTGGQTGDLLFLEIRCKQLKGERDNFEQLFMAEQLKNRRMVRRFTTQEVEGVQLEELQDQASVQKLQAQLQGVSERCEALNSSLKEKDAEAEALKERVRELEASSSASEDLVAQHMKKIKHLREELAKSEADRLRAQMCLDEENLELLSVTQKVLHLDGVIAKNRADSQEQIMHLKEELAKTEFECFDLSHSLEDKTAEARKLTELVNFLENQVSKAQQKMISIQGEILHLKSDLGRSEGTWVESFCQLEQVHAQKIADWANERASLLEQMKDLEDQLQGGEELFDGLLDTDNVFEFRPSINTRSKLNRSFSLDSRKEQALLASPQRSPAWWSSPFRSPVRSPVRSHGLIQTLLDIGEASLDYVEDEEIRSHKVKLAQVEMRERNATEELKQKTRHLAELENSLTRVKAELTEEKEKAKEEAEDLAQEMAELRYQLMEMLDHERELRARTEQASVHRVEELEAQLKRSRQETVAALARRRESEVRLEEKLAEIASLQLQLKDEACSVNQLRLEIQDLKHLCETKEVEVAGFIGQQSADMQALMRANGVENINSESDGAYTMIAHVGQLSLSEDLGAESEADDNTNLTPKSEFVDAGVRLFEEWVKSGCLNMVPKEDRAVVVQYGTAQHRGEELAQEPSSSDQFHGGCLNEPVAREDSSLQSQTEGPPFPEALPDWDKWGQDNALVLYVLQEDVHIEREHLQPASTLHGNLVPVALRHAVTDEYEVEPEADDRASVLSCEVEMANSDSLQESFTATGENVMILLRVGEGHAQDIHEKLDSGDRQDDVHQLSKAVNEGDASAVEYEVETTHIERSPLQSEAEKFNSVQDCMMVAQVEGVSSVCATHGRSEEDLHVNSVSGDAAENVYRLFEASHTIEKTLLPSLKEVPVSEEKAESDLQMVAPSLQSDDVGNLYLNAQVDQLDGMPEVDQTRTQGSYSEGSSSENLQDKPLYGRIVAEGVQEIGGSSQVMLEDAKQYSRHDRTQREDEWHTNNSDASA